MSEEPGTVKDFENDVKLFRFQAEIFLSKSESLGHSKDQEHGLFSDYDIEALGSLEQELRTLLRPASNIVSRLKDGIEYLEGLKRKKGPKSLLPGILRIPEEVLGHIFCLTSDLDKHSPFFIIQTCRRFHKVGLDCKRIWTTISIWDSPEVTRKRLFRSGSADLTLSFWTNPLPYMRYKTPDVFFFPMDEDEQYLEQLSVLSVLQHDPFTKEHFSGFLDVILKHASQVRELRISHFVEGALSLLSVPGSKGRIFPALTHLVLSQSEHIKNSPKISNFPTLRHVKLCNTLPEFSRENQIISCELEFHGSYTEVGPIAKFLNTLLELEDFTFKLASDGFSCSDTKVKVRLVKLQKFHFRLKDVSGEEILTDFSSILTKESFPSLKSLSISYLLDGDRMLEEDFLTVSFLEKFPSTETLTLNGQEQVGSRTVMWPELFMDEMPKLKHLNLQGPKIMNAFRPYEAGFGRRDDRAPNLRTITLRDCHNVRTQFFADIASQLADHKLYKRGPWAHFKSITVDGCRCVTKEELEKLLPPEVLHWKQ